KKHNTFKTGGAADRFILINNVEELKKVLSFLKENNLKYFILGKGSNLLFDDEGYRGVIISMDNIKGLSVDGEYITAFSGETLTKTANFALSNSLSGMEFAHGIPGSVGGGVYMNAGAYDGCISDILVSSTYMDEKGNIFEITNEDHEFSYRHSFFSDKNHIILSSKFKLKPHNADLIKEKMDDLKQRRISKQPLEFPSAGSTFKRPEGYFAGALIEQSGLRGKKIGGAMVSEKHCGFIINYDNATTNDVLQLIDYVKKTVYEKFGVNLECEVKYIK
ncbi:MAG: UDP-N-acetylmuramate dehydrogenase, partial [Clostridia bacterium]|nr:UDP-N-acetylmuramate dehydrogenase [Clostridia bacterium]